MKNITKAVAVLALAVAAWVSQVGFSGATENIEHGLSQLQQFVVNGPVRVYSGHSFSGHRGLIVSTGTYDGSGVNATPVILFGAVTSAGRPSSPAEGTLIWDVTLHAPAYFDGTDWKTPAGSTWTSY